MTNYGYNDLSAFELKEQSSQLKEVGEKLSDILVDGFQRIADDPEESPTKEETVMSMLIALEQAGLTIKLSSGNNDAPLTRGNGTSLGEEFEQSLACDSVEARFQAIGIIKVLTDTMDKDAEER